jgi:hypothetical protein
VHVTWAVPLFAVYAWSVLALAIGATMALLHLIRKGQAAKAASLIYLVPPVSAAMAYLGFGKTVTPLQIAGFALAAPGVALVQVRAPGAWAGLVRRGRAWLSGHGAATTGLMLPAKRTPAIAAMSACGPQPKRLRHAVTFR